MKNMAYIVAQGIPNLPNGFILDHFETDQDTLDGYFVAPKDVFDMLLAHNVTLYRDFEKSRGVVTADSTLPSPPQRPAHEAIPWSPTQEQLDQLTQQQSDTALFQQFLQWKKSQGQ